jgi:hypothetical protein
VSAEALEATDAAEAAAAEGGSFEVLRADAVFVGRAYSAGEFLAGLILNAQLATVGSPDRLPADLFPDDDPDTVARVWQRALVVGLYAGRKSVDPDRYADELARLAGELEAVGYVAMGRAVARSRALVAPELKHPADGEAGRDRPTAV